MSRSVCHACAVEEKLFVTPPTNLFATTYQLDKYLKHTVPDPALSRVSIFQDPDVERYSDYVVTTASAGAVIQQPNGTTFVWVAGKPVGFEVRLGQIVTPAQDAVKLVLSTDSYKAHAYPAHSTTFVGRCRERCGAVWLVT